MKKKTVVWLVLVLLVACVACAGVASAIPKSGVNQAVEVLDSVSTAVPTVLSDLVEDILDLPATPTPFGLTEEFTPEPTATPRPTRTPRPTPTMTPILDPVLYTGTGDTVLKIERPGDKACLMHTEGNASSSHFAIVSYDANGERLELYVNTTDPYMGTRFLDVKNGDTTSMLEITADGPWSIELQPVAGLYLIERMLQPPAKRSGIGDEVLLVNGSATTIVGTHEGRGNFIVLAHGGHSKLIFNEIGDYNGMSLLPDSTVILEVRTEGQWIIELE